MFKWLFGLKCPDCGERITEDDQRCPRCGADLNAAAEELTKEAAQQHLEKAQAAYDGALRLKSALAHCDRAIEYDPDLPEAHNLRGLVLDALDREAEAIEAYREAVRLKPDFDEARESLQEAEAERASAPREEKQAPSRPVNWRKVILIPAVLLLIVMAFIGFYQVYKLGLQYLGSKTTLVFEPDIAQVSAVNPEDLETTARLLTERSHVLGYAQVSFTVSQDNQIVGKVPGHMDANLLADRIQSIGLLEFVDFGERQLPVGAVVRTDLEHTYITQTGSETWHTIMTGAEIEFASVREDLNGKYAIDFILTPEGSEILSQYTTENIGSCLGIVLDKVVISNPRVEAAIPDGQGQISGNFTKESAEELVMFLRMTPLPIPLKLQPEADIHK